MFINNSVTKTPVSFLCEGVNGFSKSNFAQGNLCFNNTQCNFVTCEGSNIPLNLSNIPLKSSISYCGKISQAGIYSLSHNLNVNEYMNSSKVMMPCISIASSNVTLNCNGFGISNATIGISASNLTNLTIENCPVSSYNGSIYLYNVSNAHIFNVALRGLWSNVSHSSANFGLTGIAVSNSLFSNITATNSSDGIYLESAGNSTIKNVYVYNNSHSGILIVTSNFDSLSNIVSNYNYYGMGLMNSYAVTLTGYSLLNNTYGIYLSDSLGDVFLNGKALNNSNTDIFAEPDSANASDNQLLKSSCGVTDAYWAKSICTSFVLPGVNYKPITNCTAITKPGTYRLMSDINNAQMNCIDISANNVVLNCAHHAISGNRYGPAIAIKAQNHINVENCTINNFGSGIYINSTQNAYIDNNTINNAGTAINVSNSAFLSIYNNKASQTYAYGLFASNVIHSQIANNTFAYNQQPGAAIYLFNSGHNLIKNNYGSSAGIGMYLAGNSTFNNISINTMHGTSFDYFCTHANSNITAEYGGINYGQSKSGCHWLAALSDVSKNIPCQSALAPSTYSLSSDYVYPYGAICFNVHANSTLINCNGHTIIATNGGNFASFINSQRFTLENCYLKGFALPIYANNSSGSIYNNTIYMSNASFLSLAINMTNSKYFNISKNNIYSLYSGIVVSNATAGRLVGNNVTAYAYPYRLVNVHNSTIFSNRAPYAGTTGMVLLNSTGNSFEANNFSGVYSLLCIGASQPSYSNTDLGSNYCVKNVNCTWVSPAKSSCP